MQTVASLLVVLALPISSAYVLRGAASVGRSRSRAGCVQACTATETPSESLVSSAIMPMQPGPAKVNPVGCPNCESEWLSRSKETEAAEQTRLAEIRRDNHEQYLSEIYEYAQHMNDTQRQELALTSDTELRKFMIESSTAPSPLMETVYNSTMERVPYEQACYICGPEQAMLLRTLVALSRPRQCLDIGCFSGYASSAVLGALPKEAALTCLDVEPVWTGLADNLLSSEFNVGPKPEFMTGAALDSLAKLEAEGRTFDLVILDADKPQHGEYYNMSLRLLRPGGVMIMFGMILFPTVEDQQAMERLHELLPNDKRVATAQLPVGCGIQLIVKEEELGATPKFYHTFASSGSDGLAGKPGLDGEAAALEFERYQLESELAAIERYESSLGVPLAGAASSGPGIEALSSKGLVALAAARRMAEEAAAAAAAEGQAS